MLWLEQFCWFTNADMLALAVFCVVVGYSFGRATPALKFIFTGKPPRVFRDLGGAEGIEAKRAGENRG